jgi:hypothetical protein
LQDAEVAVVENAISNTVKDPTRRQDAIDDVHNTILLPFTAIGGTSVTTSASPFKALATKPSNKSVEKISPDRRW